MPYSYSKTSARNLEQCKEELITVFYDVIKIYDCSILCGIRNEIDQNAAFNADPQRSKLQWPDSNHNVIPSSAVDVAPYPIPDYWGNIPWEDGSTEDMKFQVKELHRFYHLAGIVKGVARTHGIDIRWGGDWDDDGNFNDQNFDDLIHYEL